MLSVLLCLKSSFSVVNCKYEEFRLETYCLVTKFVILYFGDCACAAGNLCVVYIAFLNLVGDGPF